MSVWDPGSIDLMGVRKGGGADLVILVDMALEDDEHSQRVLLDKIDAYLRFANSAEFSVQCGKPNALSTAVVIRCLKPPGPLITGLVESCKPWAADNHVSIRLEGPAEGRRGG